MTTRHLFFFLPFFLLIGIVSTWAMARAALPEPHTPESIEWTQLEIIAGEDPVTYIDARDSDLFAKSHLKGAISIPFIGRATDLSVASKKNAHRIIVVYGGSTPCTQARDLARMLANSGFTNVFYIEQDYERWPPGWSKR
jgi:rhodanese-related sulfurtransferase